MLTGVVDAGRSQDEADEDGALAPEHEQICAHCSVGTRNTEHCLTRKIAKITKSQHTADPHSALHTLCTALHFCSHAHTLRALNLKHQQPSRQVSPSHSVRRTASRQTPAPPTPVLSGPHSQSSRSSQRVISGHHSQSSRSSQRVISGHHSQPSRSSQRVISGHHSQPSLVLTASPLWSSQPALLWSSLPVLTVLTASCAALRAQAGDELPPACPLTV